MRLSIALTVYVKELRETLRDRRTLVMMVGLPMLLYPLMIMGMSALRKSQQEASEARPSTVAVWGVLPPELSGQLKAKNIVVKPWEGIPASLRTDFEAGTHQPIRGRPPRSGRTLGKKSNEPDHPITAAARPVVLDRTVDAVLVVWPDVAPALQRDGLGNVTILYDSVRPDSDKASDRLTDEVIDYRNRTLARREKQRGLAEGFTQAIVVTSKNVATESRRAGFGLGQLLPILLIGLSFSGAFYAAVDTTAGEKERGTLQTLLCAPLRSTEIILGKFLSVWTVALVAALANIGSMAATFSRLAQEVGGLSISPANYALAFLMLLPVTFMVTAVFLAVGVFAKDFKDGQNLLTPVLMGIMLPSLTSTVPGTELNPWTAFLPIGNIALLIRALFVGEAKPDLIFLTLLASVLYAALAVAFAARVFEREAILLGGKDTLRGLFGIDRRPGEVPRATPSLALSVFAVALVTAFYGSLLLKKAGILTALFVVEYGFFLLPLVLVVALLKLPARDTLSLRAPSARAILASVLLGLAGWTVAGGLVRLMPPPESLVRALEKVLLLEGAPRSLWLVWLAVAITPAVCEELLFRGLVLSGMRRLGLCPAVGAAALLFALAHSSIYRLLPTFCLGVLFGYAVWKSGSVVTGMIGHALNNGLMATLAFHPSLARAMRMDSLQYLPWSWTAAGAVAVAAALLLLRTGSPARE